MDIVKDVIFSTGFVAITWGQLVMWVIAFTLMYLAIKKGFEPLLLLPIGFGILLANIPLTTLMEPGHGLIWRLYHYGLEWEMIPPLIFLGLGAMTDFGPVIANPKTLLLGAAAQGGVYLTFFLAVLIGFTIPQASVIGIIAGADGPTTIYLASKLAPEMMGICAVAAYSYMAMVPLIQPPVMKLLTTQEERKIVMRSLRPVGKLEKIFFPIVSLLVICLMVPDSAPLMAMFMLGNLFKESGVVARLTNAAQNELMNIITIFLGVSVGATMPAEVFLSYKVIF
ncbi:MAG: sodium ion-translocating decarboxylase subunit beta, partial [Syntrophomonadaceae bacterium]|nr:sodium ion-translocating decarboxylase subunit beta [Syntrophomonadaceae bacterium]